MKAPESHTCYLQVYQLFGHTFNFRLNTNGEFTDYLAYNENGHFTYLGILPPVGERVLDKHIRHSSIPDSMDYTVHHMATAQLHKGERKKM